MAVQYKCSAIDHNVSGKKLNLINAVAILDVTFQCNAMQDGQWHTLICSSKAAKLVCRAKASLIFYLSSCSRLCNKAIRL